MTSHDTQHNDSHHANKKTALKITELVLYFECRHADYGS
jgi:hypothetical protein